MLLPVVHDKIGTPPMRMVPAELADAAAGADLVIGSDRLRLDAALLGRRPALVRWLGLPVTVGVRAGWLDPATSGVPFRRCLHGTAVAVEDHGSECFVDVDLGHGAAVTVRYPAGLPPHPGDPVEVAVEVERLCFFDPATGGAIDG